MDELFDVFDEQPSRGETSPSVASRKRAHNGEIKATSNPSASGVSIASPSEASSSSDDELPAEDIHSVAKKLKRDTAAPVVTDAFETSQSREVAAAAGLQPKQEAASVILSHQVRHQTALPPDYPAHKYSDIMKHEFFKEPAKTYSFELDPFQKLAVAAVERNESVLVSAHTSAGKTVCAEYAIAHCLKNNQRVIYTSPIKALSNQKYREFAADFGDVGLMTGDVTINPTATCLVMTTEILRSMLYRGSEIMREVAWVVFDEVHYMRDKARGVVWEETIILLPDKVRYVFLSATIPNAMQFAEWIAKTHNQPCHVVYTDFRPTPLQHYLFPQGGDGIHLVVDEKGVFKEDNFQIAMDKVTEKQGDDPANANAKRKGKGKDKKLNKGGTKGPTDIYKLVRMVMHNGLNPVIVFSFSKRECEAYALQMTQMAFNDESEKAMVSKVFDSAIAMLGDEDRQLPQIQNMLPLLRRGIGIHHSGLLPILKEAIEILFQEGLIKVLFATETFSIGLNMPAKTVIFTSMRKFDGITQRWVTASEFIQMAGRAGRRGIDERGIVVMMVDEKLEPATVKGIVRGQQDNLNSAFYLGYNMILNLMRVEGISPEFMLERCFNQFQNAASVGPLEKGMSPVDTINIDLLKREDEREKFQIEEKDAIKAYWDLRKQIEKYSKEMRSWINHPKNCLQYMQPGRLVKIRYLEHDFGWGVVVNWSKRRPDPSLKDAKEQDKHSTDVLLLLSENPTSKPATNGKSTSVQKLPPGIRPAGPGEIGKMEVVPVLFSCIEAFGHLRIFLPKELKSSEDRDATRKSLEEVKKRFPDGIALLDPIENMGIHDDEFKKLLRKIEILEARLLAHPLHNDPRLPEIYNQYGRYVAMSDQIKAIKKQIHAALSIIYMDELKYRKRVLRRLNLINDTEVVQLKARAACEISTGDELVLSELLFSKFFNELSPEQCAACLSCFIFEEKSEDKGTMKEELAEPFRKIQAQARIIAKVSQESKLPVNEDQYIQGFKPQLMEVVFAWCKGASFAEIWCVTRLKVIDHSKMTDVYEGSLIRLFRRLEELLRQIAQASKVMGSDDLEKKFEEALTKVRRDIVAAQSLYL